MFIRKLRPNERAESRSDRISISRSRDGVVSWSGCLHLGRDPKLEAHGGAYVTVQEAETAGIAWAKSEGALKLVIDVSALYQPLVLAF